MKVVFYTALFGGHDTLKEFDTGGYDFVAFTDEPVESKTWTIAKVEQLRHGFGLAEMSPRLAAKFFKMHPEATLAEQVKLTAGDIVIWIDASITVTDVAKMVSVCRRAVEDGGHDIAFFPHPERDNIYDEMRVSRTLSKYAGQPMEEQVNSYCTDGLPDSHGLWAGGVIARRFGKTKALDELWWKENVRHTIQDQLSLPYVLWKLKITPGIIPGSVYGTDFHKHTWTGPTDKPQRRATDLCVCGATYDRHLGDGPSLMSSAPCTGFTPHPQPPRQPHDPQDDTDWEALGAVVEQHPIPSGHVGAAPAAPFVSLVTPTHNTKWLRDCWLSLLAQTNPSFEWLVSVNDKGGHRKPVEKLVAEVKEITQGDPRVRIVVDRAPSTSVGGRKLFAFGEAAGEVLVEFDHDDILAPDAVHEITAAFADSEIGFVYSDFADFVDGAPTLQGNQTYRAPELRGGWMISGMTFYDAPIGGPRPGVYDCVRSQPPTARVVSHIYTAPNHVRAWRKSVYEAVGGHDPSYDVVDDHELMLRTYLVTRFKHIPKPLYLYRITGENTWSRNISKILETTNRLQNDYLERLVLRECTLLGVPAFDLGGGLYPRAGWTPVDNNGPTDTELVLADLSVAPWPWKDGSVGAFRASDLLEHLPNKMQTMNEIHRCLRPGGWLMSMIPSALGAGAFMDPTHCSYWVPGSFYYYTRDQQAQYIRAKAVFREVHLDTQMINIQGELVPYVRADLEKL